MPLLIFIFFTLTVPANADVHHATVTRAIGKVRLLSDPHRSPQGKGPHVLHDGLYYTVSKVHEGSVITNGAILSTGQASRVRLIYDNGDQMTIAPHTTMSTAWTPKRDDVLLKLISGRMKASIVPGGPRKNLKVRTRTIVMGVRGTEFFINNRATNGRPRVTVLKGQVAVQAGPQAPEQSLRAGFMAEPDAADATQELTLRPATRGELLAMRAAITLPEAPPFSSFALSGSEESSAIKKLQKRAEETWSEDPFEALLKKASR